MGFLLLYDIFPLVYLFSDAVSIRVIGSKRIKPLPFQSNVAYQRRVIRVRTTWP